MENVAHSVAIGAILKVMIDKKSDASNFVSALCLDLHWQTFSRGMSNICFVTKKSQTNF